MVIIRFGVTVAYTLMQKLSQREHRGGVILGQRLLFSSAGYTPAPNHYRYHIPGFFAHYWPNPGPPSKGFSSPPLLDLFSATKQGFLTT